MFNFHLGFNCGEAVNFAMGDWFPLGTVARGRYTLLNRAPLIPHEKLICKEAKLVYDNQKLVSNEDLIPHYSIKVSFVHLMRTLHHARWLMMKSGAQSSHSRFQQILCNICKRDCYLAYVKCNCYDHPICLHHGILPR